MSAKLFKHGKVWYIYDFRNGKRVRVSTKTTIKDIAEEKLKTYILSTQQEIKYDSQAVIKFDFLLLKFLEDKERKTKPNTFLFYKKIAKPLATYFTGQNLYDIKRFHIKQFEADEKLKGKSDGILLRELELFKEVYNYGNENEYLKYNPFIDYNFRKEYSNYQPRTRFFSPEEIKLILDELDKEKKHYLKRLVIFILETGVRIKEALNLCFNDVGYLKKVPHIHIRREFSKNGKERFIPLTPLALKQITDSRELNPTYYIFTYNGSPFKYTPKTSFNTILKKVGLKDYGASFHTLRHTAGSLWLSGLNFDGTPREPVRIEVVSDLLGHSDISFTKRVYAQLDKSSIVNNFLGKSWEKVGNNILINS